MALRLGRAWKMAEIDHSSVWRNWAPRQRSRDGPWEGRRAVSAPGRVPGRVPGRARGRLGADTPGRAPGKVPEKMAVGGERGGPPGGPTGNGRAPGRALPVSPGEPLAPDPLGGGGQHAAAQWLDFGRTIWGHISVLRTGMFSP